MLQPGVRLGDRYRLDARIGAGGMGEVWRAVDEVLSRTVAVKVMLPEVADDPGFARRFQAEATAMAQVHHPAVASIHDFGRDGELAYLVMEFVEGESLSQLLARRGRMAPADTMRLIAQAADGLAAVHARGIVHRDIKPANLLIREDGALVITDFGIARRDDGSRLTATGAVLGTPSYLSPEQVRGEEATIRSDVYALGLTAYECLAGQRPFVGDNPYAVALQRLQSAPRTIGVTLPPAVLAVVERALATDPAHRYATAADLAEAARAAAGPGTQNGATGRSHAGGDLAGRGQAGGDLAGGGHAVGGSVGRSRAGGESVGRGRGVKGRRGLVAAVMAAVVVIGGGVAWTATRDRDHDAGANGADAAGPGASASAAGAPGAGIVAAGFAPCGERYCPTAPTCWGGLTAISGKAAPPEKLPCDESHRWETFAAIELPAGAADVRTDKLMSLPDVAGACSAAMMSSRSRTPARTATWSNDAWPIEQPGGGDWLLHCIAAADTGPSTGSAFKPVTP